MTVTKQTIRALLVLSFAVVANAGGIKNSVNSTSQSASDSLNDSSKAMYNFSNGVLKTVHGSMIDSTESASNASAALKKGAIFVWESTSTAVSDSAKSTSKHASAASEWVIDTSGNLWEVSVDGSRAIYRSTSASVKASGQLVYKSGKWLVVDASGASYELVTDSSGAIYNLSRQSAIVVRNGSKAVVTFVGDLPANMSRSVEYSSKVVANMINNSIEFSKGNLVPAQGNQYPTGPIRK